MSTYFIYSANQITIYLLFVAFLTISHYALKEVRHLSQVVTKKEDKQNSHAITNKKDYPLTQEELRRGYSWLWDDDRFYRGYQNMKSKWGNERMRRRVDRFIDRHPALFVRPITKILYNKKINDLLCFLTGIKK